MQAALQGFRRLLSGAIAERASFTWRILARDQPRPTVLRPERRDSKGSRQGAVGEPRHGPGGTSGAAAHARMVGIGSTADTSAEAALADKHENCVSLSAKCMSMVGMEDSLLPAVFLDATAQSDIPHDHGERQYGQGTDEELAAAPLEASSATGDLRVTARSVGEQWPAWHATSSPAGNVILSQAPSAGVDAVVRRHAASSPEVRWHTLFCRCMWVQGCVVRGAHHRPHEESRGGFA